MIAPRDGNITIGHAGPNPADASAGDEVQSKAKRGFVFYFSLLVIGMAGSAFGFKLVEFAITFRGNEPVRVAIVPVMTYLIVAGGFACLFLWAWTTGQFKNVERVKYRMMEMQDEIDGKKGPRGQGAEGSREKQDAT